MSLSTDPVALTEALVRCPSVTPEEGGALTFMERELAGAGFACQRLTMTEPGTPDVENLYARLGTGKPHLCFAGHTDVVPVGDERRWSHPPFAAVIEGGFLYGRGAVDMKGAIACFMAATARHLARTGRLEQGSLSFLITGDEEGPSINGTMKVLEWMHETGEVLDACLVGEPTCPDALGDEIKIGRRGSLSGEIVVEGKQGHVAYPRLTDNPVPKLARIIDRLSAVRLDQGNAHFEPSNLEVTVVSVPNSVTNVVPAEARARFNIRYNTEWTRPRLEDLVTKLVAEAAREVSAHYTLGFSGTGDVFLTKPGVLVDTMVAAVEAELGRRPNLTTGGGTSDARFIQAYCPVIEFGLVNTTIHAIDERVSVADLERLTQIYERFIAGYFAMAG
ncbi:MAG: succinyl-diaminopimelate desuccinylase [Hyphomicrobiaceae bacterium]|nr:succinyl-diaminopimelate desuccinylase [Hyphomicrobiaceae bacterium]